MASDGKELVDGIARAVKNIEALRKSGHAVHKEIEAEEADATEQYRQLDGEE